MNSKKITQAVDALIELYPIAKEKDLLLFWWEVVWKVIGDHLDEYPGELMRLGGFAARHKPMKALFPVACQPMLVLRKDIGASDWLITREHNYRMLRRQWDSPLVTPHADRYALMDRWVHHMRSGHQRKGQALFNALYDLCPQLADELRAGPVDCFHLDDRRHIFYGRAVGECTTDQAIKMIQHPFLNPRW